MPQPPRISEAEWQVMRVLWEQSPQTANEVVDALTPQSGWNPRTIKTLLNRLVNKGALGYTKHGRQYRYMPKVAEEACVRAETRSLMQRVYGGATRPMLATFIDESDLSKDDIAALRRLLDEKEGRAS